MTIAPSDFGQASESALSNYFLTRYNLPQRDALYQRGRFGLTHINRDTEKLATGNAFKETIIVADGFSASPTWQDQTRYNPSKTYQWVVTDPFPLYGRLAFSALALKRSPLGALIDVKAKESEGVANGMLNTLELNIWSDTTGNAGQVATISGAGTTGSPFVVTMVNPSSVYNLQMNGTYTSNTAADGSGTSHTNEHFVFDIDPVDGIVFLVISANNASALAANDFLFLVGSAGIMMPGIQSFIPATPNQTLYGVLQTGSPALSGWRFPFIQSISATIQNVMAIMGRFVNREQAQYAVCLSTMDWLKLSQEREGRAIDNPSAAAKWGRDVLTVRTPFGPVDCIGIAPLSDGVGFVIDFSAWQLYSLGNLPHVVNEDGLTFVRGGVGAPDNITQGDLLAMQFRLWVNLLCLSPISNARFLTA